MRLALLVLLGAAGGCGDGDDDDGAPRDAGADAAPDAESSTDAGPDAGRDGGGAGGLEWAPCEAPFECATLAVPMDHANPDGPTIGLSILRLPATDTVARIGPIFVNPGGGGGSAAWGARAVGQALLDLAPDFVAQFDIVGFDVPGAGDSAPIDCVDDDAMEELLAMDPTPDDDDEWSAEMAWFRAFAEGCEALSGDRLAYVDTESAAHDMELVREAMGDDQLNYLGISYGTLLGATYATLFPDRVRAFVLDSPVQPDLNLIDLGRRIADAAELELGRFFDDCGTDAGCEFHGGEGRAALEAAYDAILASLEPDGIPTDSGRALREVPFLAGVAGSLALGDWSAHAQRLAEAEAGDGTQLLAAEEALFGRHADGTYSSLFPSRTSIVMLDLGCPEGFDEAAARAELAELASSAPRVGVWSAFMPPFCPVWPVERPRPATPIDASAAPPMLVLAGLHDPATPFSFAQPFLDALGNGSYLVQYEGNGHGVAARGLCMVSAAIEFLLDPTQAPATESCPAQ